MKYIKYTDSPKTDDTVGFVIETYGDDGVLKNPHTLEQVFIYYIERSPHRTSNQFIEIKELNPHVESMHDEINSKPEAAERLANLRKTAQVSKVFYSDARLVLDTVKPLWQHDGKCLIFNHVENGDKVPGKFLFLWMPKGMREGSYLITWNWKNSKDGKLQSAEKLFTLYPAESKINSVYRHFVPREKYNFLFDKYIPPMYRVQTTVNDITPEVLVKFNKAIAQVFLELDDLAVGVVDLISPTFVPDGFLPALANFFNIQLRSNSATAWRNQIKHAMPLFKKKGTIEGLTQALDKAGIKLLKLTNLWQIISPYTWTDGFVISKDIKSSEVIGYLSARPIPGTELEVSIRSTKSYFVLPKKIVALQDVTVPEPRIAVIWNGHMNPEPIQLFAGDVVRVKYTYNKIPDDARSIENYIQNLPLADHRDETKVGYPLKNWNVRLIEEDDPFFSLLIPERHGFNNPVTFGKIRTTFLYSEKAFNMDTYNGSLFNSTNPCDMDKHFVDNCSGGQSSKFNVHLEFDQVSDEKIEEAKEIITDYSPFHAILHNMKISSRTTDFVMPPTEKIKSEVKTKKVPGDKVSCQESIYCQIRYKDGRVDTGRVV